jgi:Flp pilus assembly protein TadG
MALALPILLLVLLAAIDCARLNMLRNTAENAVYEGARRAIVPGASAAQARAAVQKVLHAVGASQATITVTPETITMNTKTVTVTVSLPLRDNAWLAAAAGADRTLTKTCTMTRERTKGT